MSNYLFKIGINQLLNLYLLYQHRLAAFQILMNFRRTEPPRKALVVRENF